MTQSIRQSVMQASRDWIADFNRGDTQACIARYFPEAKMQVSPFGRFDGLEAIAQFWLEFAESKPGELVYRNIEIKVLNDKQAILSANWSMNIASGFITKELWTLADDGQWYLEEDDFSLLTQLEAPLANEQRSALILVDLQNDYFPGGRFELEGICDANKVAKTMLTHFRAKHLPVIHIQHIFEDDNAPFFAPNTTGIEIENSVAPIEAESVIVKHQIDSFINTALEQTLVELGIDKIVIVGAMAQACVQTICRSAVNKGYECEVIENGIAAPALEYGKHSFSGAEIVAANLLSLTFGGAQMKTSQAWLAQNS
ncbi:isochorismatase family protein [Shewanella psychropiezotolerans]|uniref:Isochorismatase family protein n=1 Tax=Shewanella psychropiezotolerans TaxID=2593655 RepID=A0ABX5X4B8_9GAMM|nr:isochorismatase family protein [Shewanella psychropiezotolerans]QDO86086.1 isochorismatase family protein [Shewanella psychropiezotolerans]